MNARIEINKSFDTVTAFSKEWGEGDFKEFFSREGQYLDRLAAVMREDAKEGETFTVSYTVTVRA